MANGTRIALRTIGAVASAVVIALCSAWAVHFWGPPSGQVVKQGPSRATDAATPSTKPHGSPTGQSEQQSSTPQATPTPTPVFLTSLQAIEVSSDTRADATVQVDGQTYPHSIQYVCNLFCNDTYGTAEFDLGRRYSQFTATLGGNDDDDPSSSDGYFEVLLDGHLVKQVTLTPGEAPATITVPVSGALRMTLETGGATSPDSPIQAGANAAGGRSSALPDLVWGTPSLE